MPTGEIGSLNREARSAAVFDREARSAAVFDREARSAAVVDRPLVSCVILLTANDLFVKRRLIPRILETSRRHRIEIIVVSNGGEIDPAEFPTARLLTSEYGCVAKGYNLGVRQSSGNYVAIFHDDCTFTDPDWIDKCVAALDGEVMAVTPQLEVGSVGARDFKLPVAKNVPLVIRRSDFEDLGGYDEFYYAGIEDVDFTQAILSRGRRIAQVDIGCQHFGGMSTVAFLSQEPDLYRERFAGGAISLKEVHDLRVWYLGRLMKTEFKLVMDRDIQYLLHKYQEHLLRHMGHSFLATRDRVAARLDRRAASPVLHSRDRLIEFYRTQKYPAPGEGCAVVPERQRQIAGRLLRFVRACTQPAFRQRLCDQPGLALGEHGLPAAQVPARLTLPAGIDVTIDPAHLYGEPVPDDVKPEVPLEALLVLQGVKPMALVFGGERKLTRLRQWGETKGLCGLLSPYEFLPVGDEGKGGYMNGTHGYGPAEAGSGCHRGLLLSPEQDAVLLGWISVLLGWDEFLGRLLGFPACCVAAYERHKVQAAAQHGGDHAVLVLSASPAGPFDWRVNVLGRYFGPALLQHFPCSFACAASLDLARRHEAGVRLLGPQVLQDIEARQRAPVLYTERQGVCLFPEGRLEQDGQDWLLSYDPARVRVTAPDGPLAKAVRAGERLLAAGARVRTGAGAEFAGHLVRFR